MQFPATSDEMKRAGWEYDGEKRCAGCDETIEMWISPRGMRVPIVVRPTATVQRATADERDIHRC